MHLFAVVSGFAYFSGARKPEPSIAIDHGLNCRHMRYKNGMTGEKPRLIRFTEQNDIPTSRLAYKEPSGRIKLQKSRILQPFGGECHAQPRAHQKWWHPWTDTFVGSERRTGNQD